MPAETDLLGLVKFMLTTMSDAMPLAIHLTVPRRFRGRQGGVVIHHADLLDADRTRRRGAGDDHRADTAGRAATSDPALVEQAVAQAMATADPRSRLVDIASRRSSAVAATATSVDVYRSGPSTWWTSRASGAPGARGNRCHPRRTRRRSHPLAPVPPPARHPARRR
jgi:hypothetical protein